MHILSRLFRIQLVISLFFSGYLFASENTVSKKTMPIQQQIQQLRSEVATLKQQFVILNKNQQAMAKHIGLQTSSKALSNQPNLTIGNSARIGNDEATVVLMEFTDLHCPFCKRFNSNTFHQLSDKYINTNKLLFVGKHYPIVALHKNAFVASQALECAREQSDYSAAKTWLFNEGGNFIERDFSKFVNELSLNKKQFLKCTTDKKVIDDINADIILAKKLGINSTPSFVIGLQSNGQITEWKIIKGAKTIEQFSKVIEQFIARSKTKG